ncbi:MAG: ABC transporter substrate-binding protein [Clostridiales bacterium]|jgi:putative aldouronate transport system substrate-binding protein|nr:ABC transporter substrate-binding protein [Clostridiales bacterium]
MKKAVLAIAVILLAGLTGGCAQKTGVTGDAPPTLVWYLPGDKQADVATVLDAANTMLEERVGARLDLQFIDSGSFTQRMQLNMASSNAFDLCFTGYINPYAQAVQRGGLAQLDPYLKDAPALVDSVPDYAWEAAKVHGKIYAVPNVQFFAWGVHAYTFKDLADKYGLDPARIKTVYDLEPYLEQLKTNEPQMFPARFEMLEDALNAEVYKQLFSVGLVALFPEDGGVDFRVKSQTDYYKKTIADIRKWYEKGWLRPDIASVTDDSQDLNMGKYGVWFHNLKPSGLSSDSEKYGREVIAMQLQEYKLESTTPLSTMIGVGNKSKNPVLAVKTIELLNTDPAFYNLIAKGVEGKHYTTLDNGHIRYTEDSGYAPKADWKFGNQFNALLLEDMEDDVWEVSQRINDEARKTPLIGFSFDITPVQSEISQCQSVISEYKSALSGSIAPSEYYAAFESKMKEAGVETVRDEVERQYKEWAEGVN